MKLLFLYLKKVRFFLILSFLWLLLEAVVLTLYGVASEAIFYPLALCGMVGALFFLAGFVRFVRKEKTLRTLKSLSSLTIGKLPPPDNAIEEGYQALLEQLLAKYDAEQESAALRWQDMAEYYTLWVHQVKTPLAAMRLILSDGDGGKDRELREQLFKLEQYADMVLAYLRMDSESTDFLIRSYALDAMVKASLRKYASLFIHKNLRLTLDLREETVITDEKWLCFALEQVLSNAVKYTPAGGGIAITAKDGEITVADTGIGIAPEDLPRIFEKGFTGKNGRIDKHASGIGLYLTRRILTRLGHSITVTSRLEEGTSVTLDLRTRPVQPIS